MVSDHVGVLVVGVGEPVDGHVHGAVPVGVLQLLRQRRDTVRHPELVLLVIDAE